jgi:hypothetical protein
VTTGVASLIVTRDENLCELLNYANLFFHRSPATHDELRAKLNKPISKNCILHNMDPEFMEIFMSFLL